jgi:hypothetical protein
MNIFRSIFSIAKGALLAAERDKIQEKFDRFDERLDLLERNDAVKLEMIRSSNDCTLANLEAVEQKINAANSAIGALDLIVKHHFSYIDDSLKSLKEMMKSLAR